MRQERMEVVDFISNYGAYSMMTYVNSSFFQLSITIGGIVLILYAFFIWYRDWIGKSALMYRLLMLPFSRMHIFTSKLTAIVLFALGLTSLQLILLRVTEWIIRTIIPATLYEPTNAVYMYSNSSIALFFPHSFLEFAVIYGIGLSTVTVIFAVILLERSFGLLGIGAGILYGIIVFALFIVPMVISDLTPMLYMQDVLALELLVAVIVAVSSSALSYYLLQRKVTV